RRRLLAEADIGQPPRRQGEIGHLARGSIAAKSVSDKATGLAIKSLLSSSPRLGSRTHAKVFSGPSQRRRRQLASGQFCATSVTCMRKTMTWQVVPALS